MSREFESLSQRMVEDQLKARGITDMRVLEAMRKVAREAFVPEGHRDQAYADDPLPIGEGQTMSQPYIVALMAELAGIDPGDRVLDVGLGSGYSAAILAEMGARVFAIERHDILARRAEAVLEAQGYEQVACRTGDGTLGWPEAAPFDAIIVAAAGPVPEPLCDQLSIGGRLVIPVPGQGNRQELKCLTRIAETRWETQSKGGVAFVPLVRGTGASG
ncbi:MAG: protein-L-isoaspartate(D-aspartate) O-methyltransferase [Henriciella sp.]|uniref:protein-L-isoaspartate(D-aspartate) O-methyltransferase n=1 Tax=Henriciella sp. TaxID=1968823 RepID=UPI0032ECA122